MSHVFVGFKTNHEETHAWSSFFGGNEEKKIKLLLGSSNVVECANPSGHFSHIAFASIFCLFSSLFSTARLSFWWSPTLSARPEKWGIFDQIHHWCVAPSFPLFPLLPQSPMAHMTTQQWKHVGEIIIQMAPRHPGKVLFAAFLSLSLSFPMLKFGLLVRIWRAASSSPLSVAPAPFEKWLSNFHTHL